MRTKEFVCRVKGCPEAEAGRLYAGQGLSAHYTFVHGNATEGSRQIKLQRQELAKQLEKSTPENEITELPAMEVQTFPVVGGESLGEVDIRQILEEHVGRIQGKLTEAQSRRDQADFELKRLQDELKRAQAAQSAYKLEETKHGPSTNENGG